MATGDAGANHIPSKTASCRSRRVTVCRGVAKHRREAAHIWCGATQRMCPGQRKEGQIYSPPFGRASKHKENSTHKTEQEGYESEPHKGEAHSVIFPTCHSPGFLRASACICRCSNSRERPVHSLERPSNVGCRSAARRAYIAARTRSRAVSASSVILSTFKVSTWLRSCARISCNLSTSACKAGQDEQASLPARAG